MKKKSKKYEEALNKIEKGKLYSLEDAVKLVNARINNLETNLHIEIDMERIEDRSKALSYIGIEIAEALRGIPTPIFEEKEEKVSKAEVASTEEEKLSEFVEETRFEIKPSLWARIKQSKFVQAIKRITKIRIVLDVPALPEGRNK